MYYIDVLYRCILATGGIENMGPTEPASKDAPGTLSRSGSGESWRRAGGAGGAGQLVFQVGDGLEMVTLW